MKKRSGKRKLRLASILTVIMLAAGMLAGCGGNDEEVIKKGITDELESIKNLDEEVLDELQVDSLTSQMEPMGIDGKEFMKEYLSGFDYEIGEVKVDGKKATASVTLKCRSFKDYNAALGKASEELTKDVEALAELSEDELNKKIGGIIMDTVSEAEVKETDPIEISYELTDNTWTPAADTEQNISKAMLSN